MIEQCDVIVVGAGPVGMLTAIELTLAGVRVVVLERLSAPSTAMKAFTVGPLGCEALARRGMLDGLAAGEAHNLADMQRFTEQTGADLAGRMKKYSGQFAGLALIRRDVMKEPERRGYAIDQPGLEAVLAGRVRALGIEVRRAHEVTGFTQGDDGVEVHGSCNGGVFRLRGAYLVACDGGRSLIRKQAGFAFPGTPPSLTFYQAIVELDHPERLLPAGWHRTEGGVFASGPFPGRLFMLDFSGPPQDRDAPVTREEIETLARRISGKDIRVTSMATASRWADNTRLADSYRRGRVLLAGDAAHVHSPFGGQGMNLGLVDAANLGWKLAAVVRGDMPEHLLDSYTAERRPVAEVVLANTLAQVAILRPDPQAGAMRDLFAHFMQFDNVNRYIGEMMTGLATRYDMQSPLDTVGRLLGDQHGLYALMQDGHGVLLDASASASASRSVAAATVRVRCVAVDGGVSMLIRPDACVAWAGQAGSTDGLTEALRRWFNPAAR